MEIDRAYFLGSAVPVMADARIPFGSCPLCGSAEQTVTMFGRDWTSATMVEVVVAGMVVAVVFLLGLWMIMSAARRGREHRARFREARREAKVAAKERDELADRIRQDEEVRSEQETVAMPAANHAGEPVEGRHVQPTDRHQQPVPAVPPLEEAAS